MHFPRRLEGTVALVTGAGSGLGRACSLRFAEENAAVAVVDVDASAAKAVAAEIESAGGRALAIGADVTSADDTTEMTRRTIEELGRLDIVLANAGIPGTGSATETTVETWDRVIAVNLTGVWLTSRRAIPHMVQRGSGVVINMASMGALVGIPGIFSYTAAKGGVVAMTRQMAAEYGPSGVRVNAICPGTVYTPLVQRSREERGTAAGSVEEANAAAAQRFPLQRLGTVEEIAALAAFLASDEAAWVTGGIYPVDGGRSAI